MKKETIDNRLREYVRKHLSPAQVERDLVSQLFESFKSALGDTCFLIGSFARFTASRPVHDLDILFVAGEFDPTALNPKATLDRLGSMIRNGFRNPTKYQTRISSQTHSITISFIEGGTEVFAVDVVPAFSSRLKNAYGDDIYWVPEILRSSRRNREARYQEFTKTKKNELEWWIKSDPHGYISAAAVLNDRNSDFRKTTKFVKRWKHNCAAADDSFDFKSFHIEQVISGIYNQNLSLTIFDVVFKFFCDIPDIIARPQIKDRADQGIFIDEYLNGLTAAQRKQIVAARDCFLKKLEELSSDGSIAELLAAGFHTRKSDTEAYLFDTRIPVLLEQENGFRISGKVLPRDGGFRGKILDVFGLIEIDRKIEFRIGDNAPAADLFKWKVKNDDSSPQPRGEITNHRTLNDPEHSKYNGSHYVECYAIKNGICIGRAKQNVRLKRIYN
jgi:hypothetical protein